MIFCKASVSIPLMHNVARNMKQHIRNLCTCRGHAQTEPQRGGHKEEAAQPHTSRHPDSGTHAVLYVGPRHSVPVCVGPRHSISLVLEPGAFCVGARRCVVVSLSLSGPGAVCRAPALCWRSLCRGPLLRSTCHLVPDPRATHPVRGPPAQIRVPPIQPGAFPFSRREPQTLLFGGKALFDDIILEHITVHCFVSCLF